MKNKRIFLLLLFFRACATNIFSFIEKYNRNVPYQKKFADLENIYIQSVMFQSSKKDNVCMLSDEKKKELCRIIFESSSYYQTLDFYLSKIPLFKARIPCIEEELILEQFYRGTVRQKMYPCIGRHEIIRTSFIEDDYYDTFYLSDGPEVNSVTIYSHLFNKYYGQLFNVYDIVYNIDLSKLNDMIILEKDAIKELNLMKKIYRSSDTQDMDNIYLKEQNYLLDDDPLCSLPYEKKITLCNIILNNVEYKNEIKVTVNKAATEILNMNCTTKPVHDNNDDLYMQKKLRDEQRMYPCHARSLNSTESNLLLDEYVNTFFLSSGPRRNTILVYVRILLENFTIHCPIIELVENIDIIRLKPTFITREELMTESEETYIRIKEIMQSYEQYYKTELRNLMVELKPEEIMEKVNKMINNIEKEFDTILDLKARENHREIFEKLQLMYRRQQSNPSKKIASIHLNENMSEAEVNEIIMEHLLTQANIFHTELKKPGNGNVINLSRFLQIGSQVYQKLLNNIQVEMNDSLEKNKQVNSKETSIKKKKLEINNKVQTLIKDMEILARKTYLQSVHRLAEEIAAVGDSKDKQNKISKSKKTKRKNK